MTEERKAAVYVGLVFLSGLLFGGTLMNLAEHYWLNAQLLENANTRAHAALVRDLSSRLNLSTQQQKQVDGILQSLAATYETLGQTTRPAYDQARAQAREQLRALLTDHQREVFDRLAATAVPARETLASSALPKPRTCDDLVSVASDRE